MHTKDTAKQSLLVSVTFKPDDVELIKKVREKHPTMKDSAIVRDVFRHGLASYMEEEDYTPPCGRQFIEVPIKGEQRSVLIQCGRDTPRTLAGLRVGEDYLIYDTKAPVGRTSLVVVESEKSVLIKRFHNKGGTVVLLDELSVDDPIITKATDIKVYGVFHSRIKVK